MKNIIQKVKYSYDPNKFFPIYYDGQLANRNEFIKYKVHCLLIERSLV